MNAMDVLKPQLVEIGRCCYRVNTDFNTGQDMHYQDDYMQDNGSYGNNDDDEVCDANINLQQTAHGWRVTMEHVPSALIGYVVGRGGNTQKKIEHETEVKIRIPRSTGGDSTDINIESTARGNVLSAHTRIQLLLTSARQKHPYTHFLCVPVRSQDVCDRFMAFREEAIKACAEDRGFSESLFQKPAKLHLTLGMLVLLTQREVQQAVQLLLQCGDEVRSLLSNDPLEIEFQGLEYMNDDPSAVNVLYIKAESVKKPDILQTIADSIVNRFVSEDLMSRQNEHVKLHMTALNSTYREDAGPKPLGIKHKPERKPFDAGGLLYKFEQQYFGMESVRSLHISQLGGRPQHDGFYQCAGEIALCTGAERT